MSSLRILGFYLQAHCGALVVEGSTLMFLGTTLRATLVVASVTVLYITPVRLNSLNTIAMQIMLIRIPIGPLLIFEEGLNPRIGSALLARSFSISPIGFMMEAKGPTLSYTS